MTRTRIANDLRVSAACGSWSRSGRSDRSMDRPAVEPMPEGQAGAGKVGARTGIL